MGGEDGAVAEGEGRGSRVHGDATWNWECLQLQSRVRLIWGLGLVKKYSGLQ